MRIVLATKNPGKLRELRELADGHLTVEFDLAPDNFDPEETGSTFMENALIKAREAARMCNQPALADDSGIVVDALNGEPGIRSARYCDGDDRDRRLKLLQEMEAVPEGKRQAAFVCAMALVDKSGRILHTSEGRWPGRIGFKERGENGFGYDPIFLMPTEDTTSAELSRDEKNKLSHRGQAFRAMLDYLSREQIRDA